MIKGTPHTPESRERISIASARAGGRRQTVFHEGHMPSGCRECQRKYVQAWNARNRERLNEKYRLSRRMNRYQAVEYLGGVCVDCGYKEHIDGLQFDHLPRNGTPDRTALLMNSSWERIQAELQKCELVCATCHAIRTASRRVET